MVSPWPWSFSCSLNLATICSTEYFFAGIEHLQLVSHYFWDSLKKWTSFWGAGQIQNPADRRMGGGLWGGICPAISIEQSIAIAYRQHQIHRPPARMTHTRRRAHARPETDQGAHGPEICALSSMEIRVV